ncbi:MAG: lysophospholipid acyltransferase family protein [Gemmatimonadales bacterium]
MLTGVDAEPVASRTLPTRNHLYLFCVVILVEGLARLGSPRLIDRVARTLASLAYRVSRTKRARTEQNVTRVFGPSLAPAERARIVRGAFHTFWDETMSFVPWRAAHEPRPEVSGLEHLEAALAAGTGAILWESGFFGRRHIAKQALREHGFRIHQVHDERHRGGFERDDDESWLRDRVVFPYFARREREFTEEIITLPVSEPSLAFTRRFLAILQRNGILCITADVPQGRRLVSLHVLGEPNRFATGMVTLSKSCGAPLLPLFCVQDHDGRIQVIIEPPIPIPNEGGRDAILERPLRQYALRLESYIRRYPEQYRSWHYPWWLPT